MRTIEHIKNWVARIFSSHVLPLLTLCAVLWGAFLLIERSDRKIMEEHYTNYRRAYAQGNDSTHRFSPDEERVAKHFIADTLPGLMRKGLIKKYKRGQSGTMLHVAGTIWKERSEFFRQCLLIELFVYNKVNGYAASTRIVDSRTQQLYAAILPSARIEFYD